MPPLRRSRVAKSRAATARTIIGIASTAIATSAVTSASATNARNAAIAAAYTPQPVGTPAAPRGASNSVTAAQSTSGVHVHHAIATNAIAAAASGKNTTDSTRALANTGSARVSADSTVLFSRAAATARTGSRRQSRLRAGTPARCPPVAASPRTPSSSRRPPSGRNDGQAEQLELRKPRDAVVHQRQELALAGADTRRSRARPAAYATSVGVPRRQHPVEHRPRHLRKAGKEMMVADRERGDAIDRIRNDRGARRKLRHQHAVRIRARRRTSPRSRRPPRDAARAATPSAAAAACRV